MFATKKRNRRNRKAGSLQLEQLEDRRVFNASWRAQLLVPFPAPVEVLVIVVTPAPAAADLGAAAKGNHGLGSPVSDAAHDGVHGPDLVALLHQLQGQADPGAEQGGGTGGNNGVDTAPNRVDTGSLWGNTGSPGDNGIPASTVISSGTAAAALQRFDGGDGVPQQGTASTLTASSGSAVPTTSATAVLPLAVHGNSGSGIPGGGVVSSTTAAPSQGFSGGAGVSPQGNALTPTATSGGAVPTASATAVSPPADRGTAGDSQDASASPGTAMPAIITRATVSPLTAAAAAGAAALAIETTPTAGGTAVDQPGAVHHDFVARADFNPAAVAPALNGPNAYTAVRIDTLSGGTEQPPFFMPRAEDTGSAADGAPDTERGAIPPAERTPPPAEAPPAQPGAQGQGADPGATPRESGMLHQVPMAAFGLRQALRCLKDLFAGLTTGRALLHLLPLAGALAVLGGAPSGLVRWRRHKRRDQQGLPGAVPDEEDKAAARPRGRGRWRLPLSK